MRGRGIRLSRTQRSRQSHDDGGSVEKRYTLPPAEEWARQLGAQDYKVILTRTNDTFVQLEDRPALTDRQKADLFISLHFNIGSPRKARGIEVYCLTPVVLIEGGFLTDPIEQKKIADPKYRSLLTAAILQGVQNHEKSFENHQ